MSARYRLPRRTFLRGMGTLVALPALEAMTPLALAGRPREQAPVRMAFVYSPNGMHMPDWTPTDLGADYRLPPILESLAPYRRDILVLSGLTHDKARANGDGPGDHARAAAAFLTGVQPRKTHGADIQVGISVDQIAAAHVRDATLLPSLELGCDKGLQAGNCDSGYSCAYSANISWRTPSSPMAKEHNPRQVFERLFGGGNPEEAAAIRGKRLRERRSVLDFVAEDTRRLKGELGATDRRKLDEYLYGVREIEKRIEAAERVSTDQPPQMVRPDGIPKSYAEHLRLMYDIMVVAFQGDLTRVATFMVANEGSNRSYRFIDVPEGHHDLSHHGGDEAKQAKIAAINHFHMEQFAHFLKRLATSEDGDGTLLDHSMIVFGSGIGDGNRHNHDDLPVLVIGHGGGIQSGRHVRYAKETPMTNLYLSMLDRFGVPMDNFGDSTGKLEYLAEV